MTKAKPIAKKAKTEKPAVKTEKAVKTKSKAAAAKTEDTTEIDLQLDNKAYGDLDSILHDIETNIGLSQVDIKANKITTSTGLLSLDLMTSGGLVTGGWYTFFGGEQSCKSTLASTQMANAITTKIPYLLYFDYEGSFQAEYFMSIARHVGAVPPKMSDGEANQRIFGLQDEKGNWVIKPRVRYYPMSIGEKFFDYMARLMRQLPDKLHKDGKWWLVYDPENKLHKDHIKKTKPDYSESLWKKTGKWWVETDNGLPQALVVTDSYPAMNPEKMDVDDPSAAMAMQARMFSDNIKRIKGKMSAKRVTVMGINQLRLRPGVNFGNPEYEPCFVGSTVVHLADAAG
jgi:RecA/RadA recombinase